MLCVGGRASINTSIFKLQRNIFHMYNLDMKPILLLVNISNSLCGSSVEILKKIVMANGYIQ